MGGEDRRAINEVLSVRAQVIVMGGGRRVGKTRALAEWAFERAHEPQNNSRQGDGKRVVYLASALGWKWWERIMLPYLRRMPWTKGTKIRAKYIALPSGVRVEPWFPPVAYAIGVDEAGHGPLWMFAGTPTDRNLGWYKAYSALEYGGFTPEQIERFKRDMSEPLFAREFEAKTDAR